MSIDVRCEDASIANMVKCRLLDNGNPALTGLDFPAKYLGCQIELVNLKVTIALGRPPFGRYFPEEGITKDRDKLRETGGQNIFSLLHPAAVLGRNGPRPVMMDDFKVISEILENETKKIEMEPTSPAPKILDVPRENPQVFQLSFTDTSGPVISLSAQVKTLTVNVEKPARPEHQALF